MQFCNFVREYIEPKDKYICFSTSLFVPEKYIKMTFGTKRDVKEKKQRKYLKNLIEISKKLLNGEYPNNVYLRIYYDHTIKNNPFWDSFMNSAKKHPKIQLIYYQCNQFIYNQYHQRLFGTIVRFHAFFDDKSNTSCVFTVDSDLVYTPIFFKEIDKFMKNDEYSFISAGGVFLAAFYKPDYDFKKKDYLDYTWFSASTSGTKIKFDISIWNNIFNIFYNDFEFRKRINYLDFKKKAIYPLSEEFSYLDFEYGADEILLNYIFKNYIRKNNLKFYHIKVQNLEMIKNVFSAKMMDFFNYNIKMNPFMTKKVINLLYSNNNYNQNIIKLRKDLQNLNYFIPILKKNIDELNKLYFQSDYLFFIDNFQDIMKDYDKLYINFDVLCKEMKE